MITKKNSPIAVCLTAVLALIPVASSAQTTTTFSGEAVALRANAAGILSPQHMPYFAIT